MEKIDAVITWVDGADPKYQKKLKEHLKDRNAFKKQYLQASEINFCIASIINYAPFIRKVFVVTDGQLPNLDNIKNLVSLNKIKIIDHKEIFRDHREFLPTFNIRSIDALLYRVKGLSEKFIYFNDDMFIVKKTNPEDWFLKEKAVLAGEWSKTYNKQPIKFISEKIKKLFKLRPSFNAAQSKAANIAGFENKYFKSNHSGRPQIKSVIENFYDKNPEKIINQIRHKFRDSKQYMPYSLCWHLLIKKNLYVESSSNNLVEIHKSRNLSAKKLENILRNIDSKVEVKFLNIQDLNLATHETQEVFQNWFVRKLSSKTK
tara:strand:+ start:235 stop:1185 length:951 start_codon:yes stop_codon:yes gene_type:complete